MTIYIIDFGLAISIDQEKPINFINAYAGIIGGTSGYKLSDLINLNYYEDILDQSIYVAFNKGQSQSMFNDRLSLSKMIIELMVSPFCNPLSNEVLLFSDKKWVTYDYISWIHWFFLHRQNECESDQSHGNICIPTKCLWDINDDHIQNSCKLVQFLMEFTDPQLFIHNADLVYWQRRFHHLVYTDNF